MNGPNDSFSLIEDGTLELGDDISSIVFHQNLNVFLVITRKKGVRIFDPHSSLQLAEFPLESYAGVHNQKIQCTYLQDSGCILFCGGKNLGLRQDHQGVLLLNTILQTQVESTEENVVLEMLLSEALQLQQIFHEVNNVENASEFKKALSKAVKNPLNKNCSNPKVCKWRTVCVSLPLGILKGACSSLVTELCQMASFVPAMSLASAFSHRLNNLIAPSGDSADNDKESMFSEAARLATFTKWPHMNYKWALPEQMAQAGFFHQPVAMDDDRAMCFICNVCLVYWEPTDEPWSEHERHAPNCPYVKGEYTSNVPLSVTYAASPAQIHATRDEEIIALSTTNSKHFAATATRSGSIVIWNIFKELRKEISFFIDPSDPAIFDKHSSNTVGYTDIPLRQSLPKEAWPENQLSTVSVSMPSEGHEHFLDLDEVLQMNKLEHLDSGSGLDDNEMKHCRSSNSKINVTNNSSTPSSQFNSKAKMMFTSADLPGELFTPPRPNDVQVSSLCIFADYLNSSNVSLTATKKCSHACLAVGASLRRYDLFSQSTSDGLVQVLNTVNQALCPGTTPLDIMSLDKEAPLGSSQCFLRNFIPYLLIYDISSLLENSPVYSKVVTKSANQGSSKKSTRKVSVPSGFTLINMKVKQPYKELDGPNKMKTYKESSIDLSQIASKLPKCAQCISVPVEFNKVKTEIHIQKIIVSLCGKYLLVLLTQNEKKTPNVSQNDGVVGGLILYQICIESSSLCLRKEPVCTKTFTDVDLIPREIVMVPAVWNNSLNGQLAGCVCEDGHLRILSLSNLEYIRHLSPQDQPYNNLVYCHSLERICATKADGTVVLVQLKEDAAAGSNDDDIECSVTMQVLSALCRNEPHSNVSEEIEILPNELLVNQAITEEILDKCIELTNFQLGCPRFVATVPACWSEIIQAQKQRRNPQHLQHQGEDVDTTRTWRLDVDSTTYDEHIFDILLPPGTVGSSGHIQVGHVDLKLNFNLASLQAVPKIQVTLLKQNLKGPRKDTPTTLADVLLDAFPENPVVTKDFLLTHKAEILCGPVTVNQHLDLSGQAANVTLTSPALLASRCRSFLIHIKALDSHLEHAQMESKKSIVELLSQYSPPHSSSIGEKISSVASKKAKILKGCDVIKELSLTIHCCSKTSIPHERLQRLALVEKNSFQRDLLLMIVDQSSSDHIRHRALDLFLWIFSIQTASKHQYVYEAVAVSLIEEFISSLIRTCIVNGDRFLAHKVTKIIISSMESISDATRQNIFGSSVLEGLLQYLDAIAKCVSAGGMHWFFALLNHFKWCDQFSTSAKVTELLSRTSEVLREKTDPLHSLIQAKFSLYGTPLERELFDSFPPLFTKQMSAVVNSRSSGGANLQNTSSHNNNSIYLSSSGNKDCCINVGLMSGKGTAASSPLSGPESGELDFILGQNGFMSVLTPHIGGLCGLLEVEPLHFSLHMASDGTKLERIFSGPNVVGNPYLIEPVHIDNATVESGSSFDAHTQNSSDASIIVMPPESMNQHKAVEDNHMEVTNKVEMLLSQKVQVLKQKLNTIKDNVGSISQQKIIVPSIFTKGLKDDGSTIENIWVDSTNVLNTHWAWQSQNFSGSTSGQELSNDTNLPKLFKPNSLLGTVDFQNGNDSILSAPIVKDFEQLNSDPLSPSLEISSSNSEGFKDESNNSDILVQGRTASTIKSESPPSKSTSNSSNTAESPLVARLIDRIIDFNSSGAQPELTTNGSPKLTSGEEQMVSPDGNSEQKQSETSKDLPSSPDGDRLQMPFDKNVNIKPLCLPPQHLLSIPPQQMMVIEKMHSGARRFVVLDFGSPIVLTDVIIPSCSDLISLTIDIWLTCEETDGERLAVASDIGIRSLVLADLQPPPLCRYLKVTILGRYGMITSQCKIPVGAFYGHTIILPWYLQPKHPQVNVINKTSAKSHLSALNNMLEDIGCRYSLACSKLRKLLRPLNASSEAFLSSPSSFIQEFETKIKQAYQDCILQQQHLNLILASMKRLQTFLGLRETGIMVDAAVSYSSHDLMKCSSDKLSILLQHLLNCLLTLTLPPTGLLVPQNLLSWCERDQARSLIENICIRGPSRAQASIVALLARLCSNQPWWGEFSPTTIVSLFSSGQCSSHFPTARIFALLTFFGQKSIQSGRGKTVIDSVILVLIDQLKSREEERADHLFSNVVAEDDNIFHQSSKHIDPQLVSWLLLYLSLCLDSFLLTRNQDNDKRREARWAWISAETCLQKRGCTASKAAPKSTREKLRKRLVHHKQQLTNLESATKNLEEVLTGLGCVDSLLKHTEHIIKNIQKQHVMKHFKDLCSIQKNETNALPKITRCTSAASSQRLSQPSQELARVKDDSGLPIDRDNALKVIKELITFLMSTTFPCSVDLFLLGCKVIGGLVKVSRPSLKVCEILSESKLCSLFRSSYTVDQQWGSPWALQALTCLLYDVLEGERLYGVYVGMNATDNHKEEQPSAIEAETSSDGETGRAKITTEGECDSSLELVENHYSPGTNQSSSDSSMESPHETSTSDIKMHDDISAALDSGKEKILDLNNLFNDYPQSSTVSTVSQADQSATSVSPPSVNVALPHFTPIEEEDGADKYCFLGSDAASTNDHDEMDYLTDLQTDLNSYTDHHHMLSSLLSIEDPINPVIGPWVPGTKSGKESRVGDLITAPLSSQKRNSGSDHSTAMDARLENGISLTAELRIHMMNAIHSSRLAASISSPLQQVNGSSYATSNSEYGPGELGPSIELLDNVFQEILRNLALKCDGSQLEYMLELWLNLNLNVVESEYCSSIVPFIPLQRLGISYLLKILTRSARVSIRCWCLGLQALTICCNLPPSEEELNLDIAASMCHSSGSQTHFEPLELSWMSLAVISDVHFIPMLFRLLNGNFSFQSHTRCDVVGGTLTNLFEDFLFRLEVKCDVIHPESGPGNLLKVSMLNLVMRLLEPDAAFFRGCGPLDVQRAFLGTLLSLHYNGLQKMPVPLTIINSVASVVDNFLSSGGKGMNYTPDHNSSLLGGLFASVLGSDLRQGPLPSRKIILCSLIQLARKLIQLPLNPIVGSWNVLPNLDAEELAVTCLTDSLKLQKQMDGNSLEANSSQTDEHKAMQDPTSVAGVPKSCTHSQTDKQVCIADAVLENEETMQMLLSAVGRCEGNSVTMILLGIVNGDMSEKFGLGETLMDSLYQLLLTLNNKATNADKLVAAIIRYITPNNFWCEFYLSEALFGFITHVLDCTLVLTKFCSMRGIEMMWENLVNSVGMLNGGRFGLIATVMNQLSPPLPASTLSSLTGSKRLPQSPSICEMSKSEGFHNFAPLSTISSSNPTARPADALIRSTQFPRTKSPPWSYHFYPDENWVDLTLTLPCSILLHEIHIIPHNLSSGIVCPSGVLIETGLEGGCVIPITGIISTSGLACIQIVLPQPVVASVVVIKLYKPYDQPTLGLSSLKLLGTTTFRHSLRPSYGFSSLETEPYKRSYWWLQIINHCMSHNEEILKLVIESGARVPRVMEACVTLLLTSSSHASPLSMPNVVDPNLGNVNSNHGSTQNTVSSTLLENTILSLVSKDRRLLYLLFTCLFDHPLLFQPSGSPSNDAAVTLLYMVSKNSEGVKLLVHWLSRVLKAQTETSETHVQKCVNAEILHCIASVLWNCRENVSTLITEDLFRLVYKWLLCETGEIKEGLKHILCSMGKIQPHLFTQLLLQMGILTVVNSSSLTDDRKDREAEICASGTDDMKEGIEERIILQDPSAITFTPEHLQILAIAAQSPPAVQLMLDSGIPLLLVHGILEWCKAELLQQVESCTSPSGTIDASTDFEKADRINNSEGYSSASESTSLSQLIPSLNTLMVANTLETLALLSEEPIMKDWVGSGEGSVFWIPLLTVLGDPICSGDNVLLNITPMNHSNYSQVEEATIQLMKCCCHNHPNNQKVLASAICHLIQRQNTPPPGGVTYLHSLSSFTRCLIIQILLESDKLLVQVSSTHGGLSAPPSTLPPLSRHPKYGTGHKTRLLYLPVSTRIEELLRMITDWCYGSAQNTTVLGSDSDSPIVDGESAPYKQELGELGLELVDKFLVATGVMAKDKRNKDRSSKLLKNKIAAARDSKTSPVPSSSKALLSTYGLIHEHLFGGNTCLPGNMMLAQVLAAIKEATGSYLSELSFSLVFQKDIWPNTKESAAFESLLKIEPLPSMLNVFTNLGGLPILAQHMTLLYPDTSFQYVSQVPSRPCYDDKPNEKLIEDDFVGFQIDYLANTNAPELFPSSGTGNSPGVMRGHGSLTPIPPHSLGSFTLFLRLPGYAETIFSDPPKACLLLRLALGMNDGLFDGNLPSAALCSLATLPFESLEYLLKTSPLTTDDGIMLRKMCLNTGSLHLILACLATLSHQESADLIFSLHHPNVPIGLIVSTIRASSSEHSDAGLVNRNDSDRCHYWAKGTGFGTGSTNQSWNIEQALIKQKLEEHHVVWLIRIIAHYINPDDVLPSEIKELCIEELGVLGRWCDSCTQDSDGIQSSFVPSSANDGGSFLSNPLQKDVMDHCEDFIEYKHEGLEETASGYTTPMLPPEIYHLFLKSCLISKIASYLSNDSVLDMSRHVPLYRALMALVRGIAVNQTLIPLLMPPPKTSKEEQNFQALETNESTDITVDLPSLLAKMKNTVNTYMMKLKCKTGKGGVSGRKHIVNKEDTESNSNGGVDESDAEDQGLSLLLPDIQLSAKVVEVAMQKIRQKDSKEKKESHSADANGRDSPNQSPCDTYLNSLRPLQFDSYEMIVEDGEGGIRFTVPYRYESLIRTASDSCSPKHMKRLAQEAVTLSTSLPLSYSSSVFVRTDTDRLDVMKVLITGPEDTPYANGCFEFDVYFPNTYPNSPLYINLQTTGEKRVRFNPNLYQDGKVCLSILNTWHGRPEEKWNPQTSSLLQVLVSIQSLIFVPEPYFNEPGYERSRGSQTALNNSQEYDASIRAATVRWAMLNQLKNPPLCFKKVIERHFWLKQNEILAQVAGWISEMETLSENRRSGRVLPNHVAALKKLYQILKEVFSSLVCPKELENLPLPQRPKPEESESKPMEENSPIDDSEDAVVHSKLKKLSTKLLGGEPYAHKNKKNHNAQEPISETECLIEFPSDNMISSLCKSYSNSINNLFGNSETDSDKLNQPLMDKNCDIVSSLEAILDSENGTMIEDLDCSGLGQIASGNHGEEQNYFELSKDIDSIHSNGINVNTIDCVTSGISELLDMVSEDESEVGSKDFGEEGSVTNHNDTNSKP